VDCTSETCLAESQIFFLDKQSETCQNNLGLLEDHLWYEASFIFEKSHISYKMSIIGTVVVYFQLFSTCSIFGSGKKYSAGLQIFFLDKQSETCQKQPGTFAVSFSVINVYFMPNVEYFDSFAIYMRRSNCHEKYQACNRTPANSPGMFCVQSRSRVYAQ